MLIETKRFVSQIMSDYYYLKAHTDPAVVAFNKEQNAKKQLAAQKQTQAPVQTAQVAQAQPKKQVSIPKINIVPQFVATAPTVTKAPVPMEKAQSVGQTDILDLPLDADI